ncbi:hypothetical protein [Patiriisocius hiemis]|uniref:Uncharacterized protein n=1 Tax=Patiriisocius hiemis TaxID=3075604 RepID=A0ABU2Y8C0_9FLAO|nr:hypothetical protein [Constantimarinum sp. W242]MDT0554437.1 hypothetical protein [Constantimarinum sp. W242]
MKNQLKYLLISVFGILLIPLLAMQFTDEVQWNLLDFIVATVMLLVMGAFILFFSKKITSKRRRIVLLIAIITLFILVWAELAVGIFGSPIAGS